MVLFDGLGCKFAAFTIKIVRNSQNMSVETSPTHEVNQGIELKRRITNGDGTPAITVKTDFSLDNIGMS